MAPDIKDTTHAFEAAAVMSLLPARPRILALGEPTHGEDALLELRNDVGLLSEEWGAQSGRHLGNTPQAFSHFALVTSALELNQRRPRRSDKPLPSKARTG